MSTRIRFRSAFANPLVLGEKHHSKKVYRQRGPIRMKKSLSTDIEAMCTRCSLPIREGQPRHVTRIGTLRHEHCM